MADETTQQTQETPAGRAAPAEAPAAEAPAEEAAPESDDLGLDLMDVFSEDDETNEELLVITRGLMDVEIGDIVGDLRTVTELIRRRQGR